MVSCSSYGKGYWIELGQLPIMKAVAISVIPQIIITSLLDCFRSWSLEYLRLRLRLRDLFITNRT